MPVTDQPISKLQTIGQTSPLENLPNPIVAGAAGALTAVGGPSALQMLGGEDRKKVEGFLAQPNNPAQRPSLAQQMDFAGNAMDTILGPFMGTGPAKKFVGSNFTHAPSTALSVVDSYNALGDQLMNADPSKSALENFNMEDVVNVAGAISIPAVGAEYNPAIARTGMGGEPPKKFYANTPIDPQGKGVRQLGKENEAAAFAAFEDGKLTYSQIAQNLYGDSTPSSLARVNLLKSKYNKLRQEMDPSYKPKGSRPLEPIPGMEDIWSDKQALTNRLELANKEDAARIKERIKTIDRANKKIMKSDEGVPPSDKQNGPTVDQMREKQFPSDTPINRVQSEINKITEFAKKHQIELSIDDIANHVYGTTETWAKKRVRDAMKKMGNDTIGVSPPPTPNLLEQFTPQGKPMPRQIASNENRNTNDVGLTRGEQALALQETQQQEMAKWVHDYQVAMQEGDTARAKLAGDKIKEARKNMPYNDAQKEFTKQTQDIVDQAAIDLEANYGAMDEYNAELQPLVDNYINVLYPDGAKFIRNRFEKSGVDNSQLYKIIQATEEEGAVGAKKMVEFWNTVVELNPDDTQSKSLHKFATDLYNMTKVYEQKKNPSQTMKPDWKKGE